MSGGCLRRLQRVDFLTPPPRHCQPTGGRLEPTQEARSPRLAPAVEGAPVVAELLHQLGHRRPAALARPSEPSSAAPARGAFPLALIEEPAVDLPAQGYRLRIGGAGIDIVAPDRAGLLHGAATLRQWLALEERAPNAPLQSIATVEIEDWPDFLDRGVMLDISRDQVPTLATLEQLTDLLASWKINQLQLYTEHTFAYAGHEDVWRDWSPLSPADVRALDAFCHERGIELVPNQNSFGHMHRWLVHHPYRRLAECPEGLEHPWSNGRKEPFSLCPIDPGSLTLLDDLYEQLLPCFRSERFNVGLDETFDLGRCRSAEICAARGRGRVYLDFLRQVHDRVTAWGRRMMFWGDIALEHPELLGDLPGDSTLLLWGYEAEHPFVEQAAKLALTGLEWEVCPGTSSWLSFGGRWSNALANLAAAAVAGVEHGARGLLITDWGDRGHLQPLAVSLPPLLAGASFAWNAATARSPAALPIAELVDRWATPGTTIGAAALALGDVHLSTGRTPKNSTVPFNLLVAVADPLSKRGFERLDPAALAITAQRAGDIVDGLGNTSSTVSPATSDLARRELMWAGEAIRLGCDLGRARLEHQAIESVGAVPALERRALAARLDDLIAMRRELWLERSRPGGLADALGYLRRARDELLRE